MTFRRLAVVRSHAGFARFLAECSEEPVGEIPRPEHIPSPYAYSPEWPVYEWRGLRVVTAETAHRRYEMFEVLP